MSAAHGVRRYPAPRYPTRLEVLADPHLLAGHVPREWLGQPELAGAVALFLAANLAAATTARAEPPADGTKPAVPGKAALVAPIFQHGDGRGSTGCVAVAPPVFLSEEEAFQVIKEELAARGVDLSVRDQTWDDVQLTPRIYRMRRTDPGPLPTKETAAVIERGAKTSLHVDGVAPAQRVAVEFVSQTDYRPMGGLNQGSAETGDGGMMMSTVGTYDFQDLARHVAGRVQTGHQDQVYFGVFYEPAAQWDARGLPRPQAQTEESWETWRAAVLETSRTNAKRLLREQVKDFADWLKAQGAL